MLLCVLLMNVSIPCFFGVLLGYVHHFYSHLFGELLSGKAAAAVLAILSGLLLCPALMFSPSNPYMLTIGLSMLYMGFGIVLIMCLYMPPVLSVRYARIARMLGSGFAFVGMHSYSIYLWHLSILHWNYAVMRRLFQKEPPCYIAPAVYIGLSLIFGVLMARVVEYPMLQLRDRLFPAMLLHHEKKNEYRATAAT